jgi:hypothetical protein
MTDILPFLKSLLSISGLSGFEGPAAKLIEEKWRPLVDETSISPSVRCMDSREAPARSRVLPS